MFSTPGGASIEPTIPATPSVPTGLTSHWGVSVRMRIAVNASIVDEAPTGLGLYAINVVRQLITILDVSDEVTVFTGYSPAFSDLGVRIVNTGRLARPSFG